jgi:hypothetical protein
MDRTPPKSKQEDEALRLPTPKAYLTEPEVLVSASLKASVHLASSSAQESASTIRMISPHGLLPCHVVAKRTP